MYLSATYRIHSLLYDGWKGKNEWVLTAKNYIHWRGGREWRDNTQRIYFQGLEKFNEWRTSSHCLFSESTCCSPWIESVLNFVSLLHTATDRDQQLISFSYFRACETFLIVVNPLSKFLYLVSLLYSIPCEIGAPYNQFPFFLTEKEKKRKSSVGWLANTTV